MNSLSPNNTAIAPDSNTPSTKSENTDFVLPALALLVFIVVTCVICNTLIAISLHTRRKYIKRQQLASTANGRVTCQTLTPAQQQALDFNSSETFENSEHKYDKICHPDSIKAASSYSSDMGHDYQEIQTPRSERIGNDDYAILQSVKDYHLDTENNLASPYTVSPVIPMSQQMLEVITGTDGNFGSMNYVNIEEAETHWENRRSWMGERKTITESGLQELAETV